MVSMKQLVVLALSGSAMAVPAVFKRDWQYGQGHWHGGWGHDSSSSDVSATETMTEAASEMPTATATSTKTYDNVPVVTSTTAAKTSATIVKTSAAATTASATSSSPASGTTGIYMPVQSTWRHNGNLTPFVYDSTLEANALKTVTDSDGQMVHELNPGSMAQVLAPGNTGNFESVYVGGWLCEIPTLAGLNGICVRRRLQGWDHSDGETGHAEILTSTAYTKIGCALYAGIWACDLA